MHKYVWLDDKIIPSSLAKTPFCERGFLYGKGIFETLRSYGTAVPFLDRHIARLVKSSKLLKINPPSKKLLKTAVMSTVKKNKLSSGYIRINVWKKGKGTGIFVYTKNMEFHSAKDYQKGFSAVILKDISHNEAHHTPHIKSLNYYFFVLARDIAFKRGAEEGIILNKKGEVCEGARTNIFIVKDEKLLTPSIKCGCLPGITRGIVMEIAKRIGIVVKETSLKPEDLSKANEAFLTNSLMELMPLTKIDSCLVGNGKVGRLTKTLQKEYQKLIV